ncbi:G-type lectin S-receptor-like serine/threonine-protein kinase LECRK3 [Humulus lupulus]|uniref:G-type lectin S-receptor-like serine/threonine-protein kinase LECRK3 n=1 Tax=Humulus lupulus TaxID=3486 RepID=UPI002B411D4F|nr:G-type lectin S-receptor-like serine/threonine-protein kinase LECRK3 [Humulus lupulus]
MNGRISTTTSHIVFLSLFPLVLLCSTSRSSSSADQTERNYISLGSSLIAQLNQNEQSSWQSPSGDFAFGFQQIQKDGFLLAIWFNKIPQKTIVWSANGNDLVHQGSVVELTKHGSLVLRDSTTSREVWSAEVSGPGVAHAAMLNTGNLVLSDRNHISLWESFDEPTDTLLPTQNFAGSKELVARYFESNYSRGRYHFRLDENGAIQFYARGFPDAGSRVIYEANIPTQGGGIKVTFNQSGSIYLQAKNGTAIAWLTLPNSSFSKGFYQRAILDYDGVFRHYAYPKDDANPNSVGWPIGEWSQTSPAIPNNICLSFNSSKGPGACGYNSYCSIEKGGRPICHCPIGYSFVDPKDEMKGCKPNFEAQSCEEDSEDVNNFTISSMDNVNWENGCYEIHTSVSEAWCRTNLLEDCFCSLAVYGDGNCMKVKIPFSNGLMDYGIHGKTLIKVRNDNSTDSMPSSNIYSKRKDQTTLMVIGLVIVSSSAFLNMLLLIISLVFFFRLRRKTSVTKPNQNIQEMNLQNFTFAKLEKATDGFNEQLGVGAFGVVFKGILDLGNNDSLAIAVKRLDNNNMVKEGEQEFKAEVMSIGRTNHKNLVQLIGFCNEGQHRLLVYEYMSNGSLATFLFGPSDKPKWHQRMQIALGIARGLFYLHEECSTQIIHCDIKPQNILLDDSCKARISDFGLAKILKTDQTRTTTGIRGTKGYVAPEWFRNIAVTVKVDVYSYGILLLELICCRKNVEENVEEDAQMVLADWACDCYEAGKMECLVENDDEAIHEMKMVEKCVMVALWCIQEDPSLRPTMKKVMLMLEGSVKVSTPPSPNSFISSL